MKKLLCVLCACLLLTTLCACDAAGEALEYGDLILDAMDAVDEPDGEKTYTYCGVTLTLPNTFLDFTGKENGNGYPFCFANDTIGLFGDNESKQDLTASLGAHDLAGYAALIAQINELDAPVQKDGIWTVTYEVDSDGEMHTFTMAFYETETDFWILQAYCTSDKYEENKENIWKYLTSVTFEGN